jgi:hypothetical protein
MRPSPLRRDRYALYEASVQGVDFDLDLMERIWRTRRGGRFTRFREDFCGTAQLATAWVLRDSRHRAWAVDLLAAPLEWARRHRLPRLGAAARRLELVQADVRSVTRPRVDVVAALNFSYWVFKSRDELLGYFRSVRRSLGPRGIFFANAFGGTAAMDELVETRRVPASQGPDGLRIPSFRYVWEQARFNPISHDLLCYIHFRFRDGGQIRRAFRYDWRMWTLPEIRELLLEAGFRTADVYLEGWDDEAHRAKDEYRRRVRFDNQLGWLAMIVGLV